jgi:hypothetical protein
MPYNSDESLQQQQQNSSGKKNDIFKKLITSKAIYRALNFDEIKCGVQTLHDESFGIEGNTSKDISFGEENFDHSNFVGDKRGNEDEKSEIKGLKFKAFPHKKDQMNKAKTPTLFTEGRIIV